MASRFVRLKLLMWKNVRLRRYHWFVTLIELLLPISVAYLLAKNLSEMSEHRGSTKVKALIFPAVSREHLLEREMSNKPALYYAPSNRAIDGFINRIENYFASVTGFATEAELESALQKTAGKGFIWIYFKDIVSQESLPNKLNYALRVMDSMRTKQLYPKKDHPGPGFDTPYDDNHYIAVQLILNENFIKMKTNRNKLPEMQIELFPYPEYVVDDSPRALTSILVGVSITLSILITSIPLIGDIIEEKGSGVKELMKISGLDEWMIWCGWFVHAIVISLISFPITSWILTHSFNGEGSEALHFVQYSVLLTFIILYCIANISLCFMFSSIFHKASIASSVFVICFMLTFSGIGYLVSSENPNRMILRLFSLTPVGAFILGFGKITSYEVQGIEFTWSSVTLYENNDKISLLFCMGMLLLDTFVYSFLTYFITSINPGQFGVRKSPFFLFQRLFSCCRKNHVTEYKMEPVSDKTESKFFEPVPSNVEATIQIKNLHKQFGSVHAVNGVNLNVYQGEMTALLGHNGAGKTTTMSIMTGLTSPSMGSMYFKKMDIFRNMEAFRRYLGMCPQENRTMPYLSVIDHLVFFGQLKGASRKEAEIEANEYLTMMEMQSKKNALAKELSGGMKRKLCLSIALMGKAQVLILDEPTSGMDVQSRRKLWDLLLDLRGKRTIIFTTHYMEEADALGDRIAIMNHGQIVCHGTPIFLKKAYGTGYNLTITKTTNEASQHSHMEEIIKNIIPETCLEFESPTEVVYKVPLTETSKFSTLFRNLESKTTEFGIKNMGVAATTMEQVFLKVGGSSVTEPKPSEIATTALSNGESKHLNHVKGITLAVQQIGALLKKKFWFASRDIFNILTRIIIPTLIGVFLLSLQPSVEIDRSPEPSLDLSMSTYPSSTVVFRNGGDTSNFQKYLTEYVAEKGGSTINAQKSDIEQELLSQGRADILKYNKNYISAFEFNSTSTKLLHNPKLIHALPITITTYSNVLLRSIIADSRFNIETSIHPVPRLNSDDDSYEVRRQTAMALLAFLFLWFGAMAFYTIDLTSYFSSFVNMERIDGFYHIQMMSKISPFLYWTTTFAFDLLLFSIIVVIRVGLFKLVDHSKFLAIDPSLGIVALILILYGSSVLLFTYVTGYLSNSKGGSHTLLLIFNLICGIAVTIFYEVEHFKAYERAWYFFQWLFYIAKAVILIMPSLNFSLLFIKTMVIFQTNTICSNYPEKIKLICEAKNKKKTYLEFPTDDNPDGLMLGIVFLVIDIVLYAAILSLINMGYVGYWWNALKNTIFGTDTTNNDVGDNDVQQELHAVQQYKNGAWRSSKIILLADGLRKNYIKWFKPMTAVSSVSFTVEPGECFGLLGVNGAGKSTTFKMLTGEILPTLGDSSIDGVKLSAFKIRYLSMAGYCPQTNSFIEVLTGREMLSMIAAMRGVAEEENKSLVDRWIKIMGLEEFRNQRCGTYSGGNKRKLCTAMSLIGDPRVVFLDEPTSGVDPVSKRNLYDVMARSKATGQAVVLTSHSMEECETLCDRITIMKAGVMKCIGSAQELKKTYAQGFSALIKINDIPETDIDNHVLTLKQNMLQTFTPQYCVLKDEHRGLLYYQIKDISLPWSTLFEKMEALKHIHRGLVEDYVLTETTLEEVFMSFAKEK